MKRNNNINQKDIVESMQMTMNIIERISLSPSKEYFRKEHIEILKLEYDKATKFFAMGNATSMGYTTFTLGLFFNGNFGRGIIMLIQLLGVLWRTIYWNVRSNNIFHVLKEKIVQ